jgi:undecaprenyl-diphosphatase
LIRWRDRHELGILATIFLLAGGGWVFIELAENVMQGDTRAFDVLILLSLRNPVDLSDPIGPKWVEEIGRDFTALGGMTVLMLLTCAVIGFLLLDYKRRTALLVAVSVGSGIFMSLLLKLGFDRPRPELVPHESYVYTTSFPSGHSMMSAVTYLTLAALLCRVQKRLRIKLYLLSLATLLTIGVGISRIYMGVHWPTDVLAGWTAGAFWTLVCWQFGRWLQRRGRIEPEGASPQEEAQMGRDQIR